MRRTDAERQCRRRLRRAEQALDLVGGIGRAIDACERLRAFAGALLE
jgi:hypothetical protein